MAANSPPNRLIINGYERSTYCKGMVVKERPRSSDDDIIWVHMGTLFALAWCVGCTRTIIVSPKD